jgi:hypothetical protein
MKAVVVYEPLFARTRAVAQAVTRGLDRSVDVLLLSVSEAHLPSWADVDLLVVGKSRTATLWGGERQVMKAGGDTPPEPGARTGLREWLARLEQVPMCAAAFDVRSKLSFVFSERASRALGNDLAQRGMTLIVPPATFVVDERGYLEPGEAKRAEAWGANLGGALRTRRTAV